MDEKYTKMFEEIAAKGQKLGRTMLIVQIMKWYEAHLDDSADDFREKLYTFLKTLK